VFPIFQRASEGDLLDFINRQMKTLDELQGWALVTEILSSIALGLAAVHRRGIIHGDLHPANILVSKRYYPTAASPTHREEYTYLLSDFGQGKRVRLDVGLVTSSSTGRFVCARGQYISPEVLAGQSKSIKSDVYAFGRIGRKVIHFWRWMRTEPKSGYTGEGGDLERLPAVLKGILDRCVIKARDERPEIAPLVRPLEDLGNTIVDGTAEWCPWVVNEKEYLADKPRVVLVSSDGELELVGDDMSKLVNEFSND